jgi:hypothetical protein
VATTIPAASIEVEAAAVPTQFCRRLRASAPSGFSSGVMTWSLSARPGSTPASVRAFASWNHASSRRRSAVRSSASRSANSPQTTGPVGAASCSPVHWLLSTTMAMQNPC